MDMVEKVARAILQHRHPMTRPEDMWLDPVAIREARVAIEAMLDPTEALKVQGELAEIANGDASYIWKAMIYAALRDDNELA